MLKNTKNSYGAISKFLHWSIFILLCVQFYLVFAAASFENSSFNPVFWHKSLGVILLFLGLFFIAWRLCNKKPALPLSESPIKKRLALAMHHSLLTFLVVLPLLGYAMSCAGGRSIHFLGLATLPCLFNKNEALSQLFFQCHQTLGFVFAGLIALHILAALHHHFIQKDNILKRMLPFSFKKKI